MVQNLAFIIIHFHGMDFDKNPNDWVKISVTTHKSMITESLTQQTLNNYPSQILFLFVPSC